MLFRSTITHNSSSQTKQNRVCVNRPGQNGGDEEDRTLDLTDANRTLSQLSYAPKDKLYFITPFKFCTEKVYWQNNEFLFYNQYILHNFSQSELNWRGICGQSSKLIAFFTVVGNNDF